MIIMITTLTIKFNQSKLFLNRACLTTENLGHYKTTQIHSFQKNQVLEIPQMSNLRNIPNSLSSTTCKSTNLVMAHEHEKHPKSN